MTIPEIASASGIMAIISGLWWYIVSITIENKLNKFRTDLIAEINSAYVRADMCQVYRQAETERFEALKEKLL